MIKFSYTNLVGLAVLILLLMYDFIIINSTGATAGALLTAPLEIIKTRLQVGRSTFCIYGE